MKHSNKFSNKNIIIENSINSDDLESHFSQEIEMAASELYNAAKDATDLHDMIKNGNQLEPWQQSKVTKAADYLSTVLRSLGHDAEMGCCNDSREGEYCPVHNLEECNMYESAKKGLYYYVNKRKKSGTSRGKNSPTAPTDQDWVNAAKTAKKENIEEKLVGYLELKDYKVGDEVSHGLIGPCVVKKIIGDSVVVQGRNGKQYRVHNRSLNRDIEEGSMGGINRPSGLGLSSEHVLDDDSHYETNAEKQSEYKKSRELGKAAAKEIELDKEEINYDEKLAEFIDDVDYNDDYVDEESVDNVLDADLMERGDNFDIELENLIIESTIIGFVEDGVVVGIDDQSLRFLKLLNISLSEAEYHGRKVQLNKPTRGDVKKFKVFVKDPKTGNIKKVNFGDPNMRIKKSNPKRRKSFRARHHCENPGPKTKARYWSCRAW